MNSYTTKQSGTYIKLLQKMWVSVSIGGKVDLVPRWGSEELWRPCIPAAAASPRLRSAWPLSCSALFPWQPRYSPSPACARMREQTREENTLVSAWDTLAQVTLDRTVFPRLCFSFTLSVDSTLLSGSSQPCNLHRTRRLRVKCLFSSDPKTLNLSSQNVNRYFQENIRRRYVMQTDNYTVQIPFGEPRPVKSQASVHLFKVVWHAHWELVCMHQVGHDLHWAGRPQ